MTIECYTYCAAAICEGWAVGMSGSTEASLYPLSKSYATSPWSVCVISAAESVDVVGESIWSACMSLV